jgi:methylated-DNA-[protein]-cysteine S-methyltransferase
MRYHVVDSPIGALLLLGDGKALAGLRMEPHEVPSEWSADPGPFREAESQLGAYFAGELTDFDLPLAPHGTAFQLRVWSALSEIPYGTTTTYGALAAAVGRPDAVRRSAPAAARTRSP